MSQPRRPPRPLIHASLRTRVWRTLALAGIIGIAAGCREKSLSSRRAATPPTVASLVPAATDLLIGMGAGAHLVAVSTFDTVREGTTDLPRVGDYLSTDWEMLSKLRPAVMVIQLAKERLPAGFAERARAGGMELVNVKLDRLEEVYPAIEALGRAVNEPQKAQLLSTTLRARLDAVSQRVAGQRKVKTLIVLNEEGGSLVGPGNVLDDLLAIAGGENAAASLGSPWPTADQEKLRALAPEVVLVLDPNPRANALEMAKRFWQKIPDVPAAREGRIYLISDWYVLLHGSHVADLAETMADRLHPRAVTTRAAQRFVGPALADGHRVDRKSPSAKADLPISVLNPLPKYREREPEEISSSAVRR